MILDRQTVNASLKRNIKNGNQYNQYFEKTPCTSTYLGKSNTDFTLLQMKKWSNKYAYQSKAISEVLKGNTLQQTVANIYNFLYNHIQYEIDGADQILKSTACAWATRSTGNDCKTFSLIASTILQILNISHSFRKVKQRNLSPGYWTHVYVVIPTNQITKKLSDGYLIIDATVNPNIEVDFLKKKDLPMNNLKHYGLNAGATNDAIIVIDAVAKFQTFLDKLETNGVSPTVTSLALQRLEQAIENGHDPTMQNLFAGTGLNAGLSIPNTTTTNPKQDSDGVDWGEITSTIFDGDFFSNTFGAIFANGFNLSCWRSTFTPAKVTQEVQLYHVPFFENQLTRVRQSRSTQELQSNLNYLLKAVDISYIMYAKYLVNGANWKKCSKEAIDIYVQIMTGAKAQTDAMLQALQSKYDITIANQTVPAEFTYPASVTGASQDFSWSEKKWGNATYRLVQFNEDIEDTAITTGGIKDLTGDQEPKQAGFGVVGAVVLISLVIGSIYYNQDKPPKTK